jgi:hypothetical protein
MKFHKVDVILVHFSCDPNIREGVTKDSTAICFRVIGLSCNYILTYVLCIYV